LDDINNLYVEGITFSGTKSLGYSIHGSPNTALNLARNVFSQPEIDDWVGGNTLGDANLTINLPNGAFLRGIGNGILTIGGRLSGSGNVFVSDAVLLGAVSSGFTGDLDVSGSVTLQNTNLPMATLEVGPLGTLIASGSIGHLKADAGVIDPAIGSGVLHAGTAEFSGGASFPTILSTDLNSTTLGSGYDQLFVDGPLDLSSATVRVNLGYSPKPGDTFTIVQSGTGVTGTLDGLPEGSYVVAKGGTFQIHYLPKSVILTAVQVELTGLTITPTGPTVSLFAGPQLTATASFSNGAAQDVTSQVEWSSSDQNVALVANAGGAGFGTPGFINGFGGAPGVATITASLGSLMASTFVEVPVISVPLFDAGANVSLPINTTLQFTASARFTDGFVEDVTNQVGWGSTNPGVASVTNGLVTALSAGSTFIFLTSNTGVFFFPVNVNVTPPLISVSDPGGPPSGASSGSISFVLLAPSKENTSSLAGTLTTQVNRSLPANTSSGSDAHAAVASAAPSSSGYDPAVASPEATNTVYESLFSSTNEATAGAELASYLLTGYRPAATLRSRKGSSIAPIAAFTTGAEEAVTPVSAGSLLDNESGATKRMIGIDYRSLRPGNHRSMERPGRPLPNGTKKEGDVSPQADSFPLPLVHFQEQKDHDTLPMPLVVLFCLAGSGSVSRTIDATLHPRRRQVTGEWL
jgi:hypothetical protein